MEENLGHIESRVQEIYDYQLDAAFIEEKLIDLKNRSKRNNLRVDGIKEGANKTWEDCKKELDTLFKERVSTEGEIIIESAQEVKTGKGKKNNSPRTIVCRILSYKDTVKILRNVKKLKGKNIFINEDFCQATLDHRKELWKEVKRLKEEGEIAYLQHRSIVVKRKDNAG